MNEDKFPAGTRVIAGGRPYVGTITRASKMIGGTRIFAISFDNGQSDVIEEMYLREATEEDEAKSAEVIARNEETARYVKERKEAGQRRREELREAEKQRKQEEAEEAEEAKRQANIDYNNEMRRANARAFGLESLRRK